MEAMSFRFPSLLAGCVGLLLAAQQPQKVFPYRYVQGDLPNGLRLVTVPTDFPNIVAVYIVVGAGSRNEVEPGHTGFAHLFEHLMFKGTEKFPEAKYNDTLKHMGAESNAYTTEDYTCYQTVFSKEDLPTVLMMEADRFQNLHYSEPEFKTETLAVLGEYNKDSSSPSDKLEEAVDNAAFVRSTYKHTAMGFLKDIQDMPNQYQYSLKFFDRYYRPEYTTIIVAGDVKPKAVRDLVDKYWGAWKRGQYVAAIPVEPAQQAPRTAHVEWPNPTLPMVAIAYKGPAYIDNAKDTAALNAIALLAFSPASALYQKLVVKEQKAASLEAEAPMHVAPALFTIVARVRNPQDLDYVRQQILATVAALRDKPVPADKLGAVRRHLRYGFALRMDSSDAVAQVLAPFIALRRTPETVNRLYQQFDALTPADIQKAAAHYLTDKQSTVVTLTGPEKLTRTAEGGGK